MANMKEGDRVQIVARQQTSSDQKEKTYYPFMAGLRGTIYRLYQDGRASVLIDPDSLPEPIRARHSEAEERMKNRWLESLSEEARSRLTPEEKEFHLNYVLLVRLEDLQPETKRSRPSKAVQEQSSSPAANVKTEELTLTSPSEAPKRKTLQDLERAEEEFLKSRQRGRRSS